MRRRLPALVASAVLAAGGCLLVSACGSDGGDEEGPVDVGRAAAATAGKGTARSTMTMRMSGAGLPQPVTITAQGVGDLDEPRGNFTVDMKRLLAVFGAPAGGDTDLELRVDGPDLYVKPPEIAGLRVPGGKEWVALDLEELAEAAGLPTEGLGALFNLDPASQLRALRQAKGMKEVGKEEVDGAETTHLRGTYRLSDVIAGLPEDERADAHEALRALDRLGGAEQESLDDPIRADIWIDEDGVVRRERAGSKFPAQPGTPGGSFVADYRLSDFGAPLDAGAPPDSERYDATGDLRDAVEKLAGR